MTSGRSHGVGPATLLVALSLWGCTACGEGPDEAPASGDPAAVAPAVLATAEGAEIPAMQEPGGVEAVLLFQVNADGLLDAREVELPRHPTTRGRAEALVQRIVAESGTFPEEVQVLDVFVSGRGVAVINFTLDLLEGHSGGLHAEELTVYSLSHTLVESLPAIAEVRLLVEGQETETLAGHLDLRSGFGRAPERLLADAEGGRG